MCNWIVFRRLTVVLTITFSLLGTSICAVAQRTGDSARVSVGIVERVEQVSLKSNTGRNALIGGALGWALARNQSSATQAGAALGGAALGGGGTSLAQGDNMAVQYTVRTGAGATIQVITDQTEIRIGDCVLVEENSKSTNIRRKDPAMCKPASREVMAQVEEELQEDASQCDAAKQRLFEAKTSQEVDVARQVMEILCND